MGSGISITKRQILDIVHTELTTIFEESETNRRLVDDYGYVLPETFDEEEIYKKRIRHLRFIKMTLDDHVYVA